MSTVNWVKIDDTYKLTTERNDYGFFLVPYRLNRSRYNVYLRFAFCDTCLISDGDMQLEEAKMFVETLIDKLKTLK